MTSCVFLQPVTPFGALNVKNDQVNKKKKPSLLYKNILTKCKTRFLLINYLGKSQLNSFILPGLQVGFEILSRSRQSRDQGKIPKSGEYTHISRDGLMYQWSETCDFFGYLLLKLGVFQESPAKGGETNILW